MNALKTRILLADDHALVRHGLRMVLEAQPDLQVVAEAGTESRRCAVASRTTSTWRGRHHDAAHDRPGRGRELHRQRPKLRILMLSMHENERYLIRGAQGRRVGLRAQDGGRSRPGEAGRAAMRGETSCYPGAIDTADRGLPRRARQELPVREDPLTSREQEVVKLVAEGYTTSGSPRHSSISEKTVERHRANILEKLGMRDRVELDALRDPPRPDRGVELRSHRGARLGAAQR